MLEALCRAAFDRDEAAIDRRAAESNGWTLLSADYPVLEVVFRGLCAAPLRLRLQCDGWDETPPSIALLDVDGDHLDNAPSNSNSVFNVGPHPDTGHIFVCMRGSREYHTHPGHLADRWENYRGLPGMDLGGILFQLWRVWRRSAA